MASPARDNATPQEEEEEQARLGSADRKRATMAANLLTGLRLPLAVVFWWAVSEPIAALAVLGAAGLSDVLDGWVIRRMRARRAAAHDPGAYAAGAGIGPWLDPLVDKVFVTSCLAALFVVLSVPLHLLFLMATRELILFTLWAVSKVLPGPWRRQRIDYTAGWPGKLATCTQFSALVLAVLRLPWFPQAAWTAGVVGVVAAAYYVRRTVTGAPRTVS